MNSPAKLEGQLTGKVALVTGSGQGLGRSIAEAMATAGAKVAVLDLNPETAESVAADLRATGAEAIAVVCDVTQRDQVKAAVATTVEKLGSLDVLVNNAQDLRVVQTPFMETDDEHLNRHIFSGLYGTFYFMQESYEHLKAAGGAVVNMGSGAGVNGNALHFSYAAAKEAIRATTRVTAREWGADGIRVNTICPAAYDTPAIGRFLDRLSDDEKEGMLNQIPMHRFGGGDEVASVAVFLASDAASYVTGHTIMVDGGANMDAGR